MNTTKNPTDNLLFQAVQFRRHMGNVSALEKAGFKVRVVVNRLTASEGMNLREDHQRATDTGDRSALTRVKTACRHLERPFYQLREAHEEACEAVAGNGGIPVTDGEESHLHKLLRSNYISPFGGSTIVTVTTPDNKDYEGASYCHIADMFNRKIASQRAFGAVFTAMLKDLPGIKGNPKHVVDSVVASV